MLDCKEVYIFGYSGHSYVVIESLLELGFTIMGYFDKEAAEYNPYNLSYCGYEADTDLQNIVKAAFVFPCVGEGSIRQKLVNNFTDLGLKQFIVKDPSANISRTAVIGPSTFIGKNSVINALSVIGTGVIINTGSIVEHECKVDDFTHLAPSSTLAGNVHIGKHSFIGANSTVKQNTTIGTNSILGAGGVLLNNLPDNEIWVGNPAKKLER